MCKNILRPESLELVILNSTKFSSIISWEESPKGKQFFGIEFLKLKLDISLNDVRLDISLE